ncbi:G2/mitotic-specific cyclin-B-like [Centruroides sculpturatus]|uniref:G2/mitotic-specific cyclin-B-like n=1 Tax=Centruroides sculpturatus TaxID=218467 RepID=UPI000C6EA302|nr:G2/mitotic-specific cyclin-B-like [Centruroides sculpturatus]
MKELTVDEDIENPQLSNYDEDIYKYLRQLEIQYTIRVNYLNKQTEITGEERDALIEWLVEVYLELHLEETLYRTVVIIDRFLQEFKELTVDEDIENPQLSNYDEDIYKYLRQLEIQYTIRVNYLNKQTEITGEERDALIEWLVEVYLELHLEETLYRTVVIIDRFLQEFKG